MSELRATRTLPEAYTAPVVRCAESYARGYADGFLDALIAHSCALALRNREASYSLGYVQGTRDAREKC